MFPNLKAEMARYGVTYSDIADLVSKSPIWVENRLRGKASLPIDVAIKIRNHFFPKVSYDYLFSSEPQINEKGA